MRDILIRPVLAVDLVFGLDWLPLISGRAASVARRVAIQYKATHLVLDGDAPASFGFAFLRVPLQGGARAMHSAAQNMARLHPSGSVAAVVPLEPDGHWLIAVHEGAVVARTDVLYSSSDLAMQALHELQRAFPRLVVVQPEDSGLTLETLAAVSDTGTALKRTGRGGRRLRLLALGLAAFMLAATLFRCQMSSETIRSAPSLSEHEVRSRWRQALVTAEQGVLVHGVAATHAVLRQLYGLPARMAGWTLLRVGCSARGNAWHCTADYDRTHTGADNQGLLRMAPSTWKLEFPSIDKAKASWAFPAKAMRLEQGLVDTVAHNLRHVQSAWQGMRPAFNRMTLGVSRPLELVPPRDEAGRALPRPAGLPGYAHRTVVFEGPLRSFSLLLPHTRSIAWKSVTLAMGETSHPTLASSSFRATFQGDLYERYEVDISTPASDPQLLVAAMDARDGAAGRVDGLPAGAGSE